MKEGFRPDDEPNMQLQRLCPGPLLHVVFGPIIPKYKSFTAPGGVWSSSILNHKKKSNIFMIPRCSICDRIPAVVEESDHTGSDANGMIHWGWNNHSNVLPDVGSCVGSRSCWIFSALIHNNGMSERMMLKSNQIFVFNCTKTAGLLCEGRTHLFYMKKLQLFEFIFIFNHQTDCKITTNHLFLGIRHVCEYNPKYLIVDSLCCCLISTQKSPCYSWFGNKVKI